jgi:hypothetical protein
VNQMFAGDVADVANAANLDENGFIGVSSESQTGFKYDVRYEAGSPLGEDPSSCRTAMQILAGS